MAMSTLAKPSEPLNLEDRMHRGKNWWRLKCDWFYYERAAKIDKEEGVVRVAHLINVIGKEAQDLYETFDLSEENQKDIAKVFEAFEARCVPVSNVIYERYMFNKRAQMQGKA